MALVTLADAFYEELKDVFDAEKQLLKILPKFESKAHSEELRQVFANHFSETEQQVLRLEAAFEEIGKSARRKTCKAMKGLIEEAESVIESKAEPEVLDAFLIAASQKIEHYEIATYGTLCAWAESLGYSNCLEQLRRSISEEESADEKLSEIAQSVNAQALGND